MNRNRVYLDEFKKCLSPFAQTVLDKLLDFEKESKDHRSIKISYNQKERDKNKTILFDDFPNTILEPVSMRRMTDVHPFNTQKTNESENRISVSTDLLLSVRNDVKDNISINLTDKKEPLKPTHEIASMHIFNDHVNDVKESSTREKGCVDWNELFDMNFFEGFNDCDILKDVQVKNNDNIEDGCIPSFNSEGTSKNVESKPIHVAEDKIIPLPKRKNVDDTANKINKVRTNRKTKEPSLRKEKYTKTVKNWLNNVGETADVGDGDVNKRKVGNKSKSKKTVQALLANKGGVMKFVIPKEKVNLANSLNGRLNKLTRPNEDDKDIETNDKSSVTMCGAGTRPQTRSSGRFNGSKESRNVKVRQKKVNTKFEAPFESPAPEKFATYAVHELDEHNLNEHMPALQITDIEIVTVLVYSNGFSQLDRQHASSACVPEGLVLRVRDTHYHIKHLGHHFQEPVLQLLSRNTLVCFNAKEVLLHLMTYIDISSCDLNIIDVKIGASLVSPDEPPDTFAGLGAPDRGPEHAAACALQACARNMCLLDASARALRAQLVAAGSWRLFVEVEMKALPVVAEMEHHGVCVDVDLLRSMESTLLARMKEVELQCYRAAGRSFQINSALQVRTILYEELRLDTKSNVKIRETVCKAKSTSEAMLRLLGPEHPLPRLVLEYRRLHKALATFVSGVLQHARDGVVKPTWEQSAAVTGRIACRDPNLQAIPRAPFSLALHPEDEHTEVASVCFRDAYVARAGRTLLAADFRHAECRVLALAAGDRKLQAALRERDLFRVLAAKWLGKPADEVSSDERERTKRVVYASLYGAGADTLADILRDTPGRARAVLAGFNRTFPSLKNFGRSVVSLGGRQGGRLQTPGGRTRTFPHLTSEDAVQRAHAERQAVNFIVQGSAADLCKAAMAAAGRLRGRARLVLQIHDELVWDLPAHLLPDVAGEIRAAMEACGGRCGLRGMFPVRLAAGPRWGRLTPLL